MLINNIPTMKHAPARRGFTLIELLIVIGVIAILAALAFVALNPLGRFADSRNAQRWTDVNAILAAIKLQQVDNGGIYMDDVNNLTADLYYQIGAGENCNDTCANPPVVLQTACLDLSTLIDGGYLASIPFDPSDPNASEDEVRYYVMKGSNGTLTVGACSEEQGSNGASPEITVSR
jgi:prepilin-type N-terminal cleavage/methylation domain-containing protein